MKNIYIFLLMVSQSVFGHSRDKATVSGRLTDENNQPLEFGIVLLVKSTDSTLAKGTLSAADGKYQLDDIEPGTYLLNASLTGYDKKWFGPFTLADGQTFACPEITLSSVKNLSSVEIAAVQPLFVQKPGMLVMNLENSAVRISGTAYDIVSKAPGVSVDQDGNFSLKGRPGVQIYVDGRSTYLSGDQLRDYLMNMPASDVIKLEIMTTPPAKYDANGSSGIINLITQRSKQQGFNGQVSSGLGRGNGWRKEAGISLSYGGPRYYVYGKYDYTAPEKYDTKTVNRVVSNNGIDTHFDQNVNLQFAPVSQLFRAGVDFFPTKRITFGVRCDGSYVQTNTLVQSQTHVTPTDTTPSSVLRQTNQTNGQFKKGSIGLYYSQKLDTLGNELSGSVNYISYFNRSLESYDLNFYDPSGTVDAPPSFQRSHPNSTIGIYAGQLDFTHPFHKKYKLDAGIKSSYVKTSNDLLFELQNNQTGIWTNDTTRTNSFVYTEQIQAAYITGNGDFGKWQVQAGLRGEYSTSEGLSTTLHKDQVNRYAQLFPSLFITQKLSDDQSLQYSMARRINRPAYDQLNPFYFYVDKYLYRIGNPFLQPEIANTAEVTYNYKGMLFVGTGISRTTNGITHVTHLVDSTGVMSQTVVNMNTVDNGYLSLTYSHPFTKWWVTENNATVSYNHFQSTLSGVAIDKSNVVYNLSSTETFLLPAGWKLELSAWYQSPTIYSIFLIKAVGDVSLGISKTFLDNKLRCTLNVSDLLYSQSQRVVVDFADQHLTSAYHFDSRFAFVRVRYTFGKSEAGKKSQFKNAADDLQNRVG